MFCSVFAYTSPGIDTMGEVVLQRDYKQYHKRIDEILHNLDGAQPTDAALRRIEEQFDRLADTYQTDEALGADRFKLYVAQAMIDYYRGNDQRAQSFMEEAVRVKGSSFAFAEEFLSHIRPSKDQWLTRIRMPTQKAKAIYIIIFLGLIAFFNCLFNPFIYDDISQIVTNPDIKLRYIPIFFHSSVIAPGVSGLTFFHMQYKPLFYTTYSLLYAAFGPSPFPFHFLQLSIHIINSVLIFLIFSRFINRPVSFVLSLIFLLHPINNESVVYIANMQDALFLLFGLLAFYIALKRGNARLSYKQLLLIAFFLLLSLLSKDTGILFTFILPIYVVLFSRRNFKRISVVTTGALTLFIILRLNSSHLALWTSFPSLVQRSSFLTRVLTMPRIVNYYIAKFLLPIHLSIGQEWLVKKANFQDFYVPLLFDLLFFASIFFCGVVLHKKRKSVLKVYIFFTLWFCIGLGLSLQIFPLDLTVADRWFYFPIIGLLGMLGAFSSIFFDALTASKARTNIAIALGCVFLILLTSLTVARNTQWQSALKLYGHDLQYAEASPQLDSLYGQSLMQNGRIDEARFYLEKAVALDPYGNNIVNLAEFYELKKEYTHAKALYRQNVLSDNALPKYSSYEGLARIDLMHDKNYREAKELAETALQKYPQDPLLKAYLAMSAYMVGDKEEAQRTAQDLWYYQPNQLNQTLYLLIKNNQLTQNDL